MLNSLVMTSVAAHPMVLAMITPGSNEAPFRILLGLGLIALVEIAAGLFMIRGTGGRH